MVWSDVDDRVCVGGHVKTPSIRGEAPYISGCGIKVRDMIKTFVATQEVPWERLDDRKIILLCECSNNVD
jgi:hypothetical protein